ncbi:MAG TPA: nuclear transport factor 2 family protein [Bacteroidia bacterium]|nr:nuclear transport factor 2 family protein [Bacteroidia bacterium]
MTIKNNEAIAEKWFAAFNAHDLEKLLELYDDQAKHFSPKLKIRQPETNGFINGKTALKNWWKDAFERLPNLHYEVTTLTSNDKRVFMEYIRKVPTEADMLIAEVLEIENEKIIFSRVYHG